MTMLISKFHKLIQSKLLWAAFLVVVIFSFVIWGTAVPNSDKNEYGNSPGILDGKPVPFEEFHRAYSSTLLSIEMSLGRAINVTPEIETQLRAAAWQRVATLRSAARMGIAASDDEVIGAIQHHEAFRYEGQFNRMVYKSFVQNYLGRYGFSERHFEEHVRAEIVIQKVRSIVERTQLITPLELQRAFNLTTDRFTADYALLEPALVESSVSLSDADVRAFFDKDPAAFTLPEQLQVNFVRVATQPFLASAEITDDEVQAYYDENLRDFIDHSSTTNAAQDATNLLENLTRYRPLEDVKEEISTILRTGKALESAQDAAMNLVVALTPDRDGNAPTFEAAAKEAKLAIESLPPFSATSDLPGIQEPAAFKFTAFELGEGPESYFSNPVRGTNEVYVIALRKRIESRIPDFAAVEPAVKEAALAQAQHDALKEKAEQIKSEAEKALGEKIPFADTLAFYGLKVKTTEPFSATTGMLDTNAPSRAIFAAVSTLNANEVADPLLLEDGYLLVHLKNREPAESTTLASIRPQLLETIRRQSGRLSFDSWQNDQLKQAHFKDLRPATSSEDYDEVEEESGETQDDAPVENPSAS
ncbi:MAG: SurA N-terminal domain-containing protein [Kiritimatiellae bacterium]|nr:SurA N-terminal domain-containing protein [Kiritimatiellia bacterium]MCO5067560.1 SurA N-terminal domain-containing protein [Kiritimatiellia bacterium]